MARPCVQFGISDRSAEAIATAVLQEVGMVTEQDLTNVKSSKGSYDGLQLISKEMQRCWYQDLHKKLSTKRKQRTLLSQNYFRTSFQ